MVSAKRDSSQAGLGQLEFGNLLFDRDETFNVNLRDIPAPNDAEKLASFQRIQDHREPRRLDLDSLSMAEREKFRARNTWRYCLQKNWLTVANELKRADDKKTLMSDP